MQAAEGVECLRVHPEARVAWVAAVRVAEPMASQPPERPTQGVAVAAKEEMIPLPQAPAGAELLC